MTLEELRRKSYHQPHSHHPQTKQQATSTPAVDSSPSATTASTRDELESVESFDKADRRHPEQVQEPERQNAPGRGDDTSEVGEEKVACANRPPRKIRLPPKYALLRAAAASDAGGRQHVQEVSHWKVGGRQGGSDAKLYDSPALSSLSSSLVSPQA